MAEAGFDTLVVGSGAAGAVVAARLSEDPAHRVLLVEAGPDYGPRDSGHWPADLLDGESFPLTHSWGYWHTPRSDAPPLELSAAQVIGGSTAHNACGIGWGRVSDFDGWEAAGNPGWGFRDMRRCLAKVEADSEAPGAWHGRSGPVPVTRDPSRPLTRYAQAVLDTATARGYTWLDDLNNPHADLGVGRSVRNVVDHVRWNSAFAYLDPIRERPNLRIVDRTPVVRVLVEGARAVGVEAIGPDGLAQHRADRVVLAGGAYNSPVILLRSGIGPADHLRDLGIPVLVDLPGVGENLQDHVTLWMRFRPRDPAAAVVHPAGPLMRWQLTIRARSDVAEVPCDVNLMQWEGFPADDGWDFALRPELIRPRSRGAVRLASPDPGVAPLIDHRYLSDPEGKDLRALLWGVEEVRALAASAPLSGLVAEERWEGSGRRGDALAAVVRANVNTYHHPVGTCRLGPAGDRWAVVDPLTVGVHGISSLHVADASLMPEICAALPNLTVFGIGERAAELLGAGGG